MDNAQPPQVQSKRKSVLNRQVNGTITKVVWWIMGIGGTVFLLLAGLLGNAVLDAMAAQVRVQEALADRLRMVETTVATIQTNRFTSIDGLELEMRLTERIAASVERIEKKIDLLDGGGG